MIAQERWMEIQILAKQGKSIREISRITGHSRNTVRRCLRSAAWPSYKERPPRPGKLDPYKKYLEERAAASKPHRLPASVLHREIAALGFNGSMRLVRNFMRTLYPLPAEEPIRRFETEPGQQLQVDWCVFRRGANSLSAFVATLGYSRVSFVVFAANERFETLRYCHEQAFAFFGGVPREVLYDNMRTVVSERNAHGAGLHRFHSGLWDMAKHFGFRPRLCKPYRAKTKGKVERFNRYLRNSFYYPLQSRLRQAGLLLDVATANAEVRKWLDEVANCRDHGELKERPIDRFAEEREHLLPLPQRLVVAPREAEAAPDITPWPVIPLQRSPIVYEQLFLEGGP